MNAMPQRLSIYDPRRDRMVSLNPYKAKAKEIYRHYIEDLGFDPSPDLAYHEKSSLKVGCARTLVYILSPPLHRMLGFLSILTQLYIKD